LNSGGDNSDDKIEGDVIMVEPNNIFCDTQVEWGNLGRDNRDDRIEGDVIMVEDTEVVMRHKPTAADDEQDLNLDVEVRADTFLL
jgi:cytoskeletal protein CcmA (bactofilin family)